MPQSLSSQPPVARVLTLGSLGAEAPGGEVYGILRQPKRFGLLVYLILATKDGFCSRDRVTAVFWPEFDQERARGALRNSLYFLRKAFGHDVIEVEGSEAIRIDSTLLWCDAVAFDRAIQKADYAAALQLYRGDFLAGLHLDGSTDFEEWLTLRRTDFRRHAMRVALELATRAERAANGSAAEAYLRRATEIAPLDDEPAHRLIAFLSANSRVAALEAFARFEERLAELNLSPAPETVQLVGRLRVSELAPSVPDGAASPRVAPKVTAVGGSETDRPTEPRARPRRALPLATVVAVTLGLALVVAAAGLVPRWREARSVQTENLYPNRVVVPPFENLTGDSTLDGFGGYAAQWITQGLHETGVLEPVPSMIVAPVVDYLERQQHDGVAVDRIQTFARETGAGLVIAGSYYLVRDSLQVQWQVTNADGGEMVSAPPPVVTTRDAPDVAVRGIRSRVMGGLSSRLQRSEFGLPSSAADPPSWEAFQAWDSGLNAFRSTRFPQAIAPLERAASLDSGQLGTRALLLLGITHRDLGWDAGDGDTAHLATADSIFRLVERRSDRLTLYETNHLRQAEALVRGDWLAALRLSREAAVRYPRSVAVFNAGYTARLAHRPREAAYWFESADREAPGQAWYPLWSWAVLTYHQLGDLERQLEWIQDYRERHDQGGALSVHEIFARAGSGDYEAVVRLMDHPYDEAWFYIRDASYAWSEFRAHGYPAEADSLLARVIERFGASPDTVPRVAQRWLFEAQGQWTEARRIHVLMGSGSGFRPSLNFKGQLAVYDARLGNRDAALATSRELAAMDSPYMLGRGTLWRARIAAVLDDRAEAVGLLRQAFDEGSGDWIFLHTDRSFESLRDDPAFQEVLRPRDGDWQPPGAARNKLLTALLVAGLLSVLVMFLLGRRERPRAVVTG